MTRTRDVEINFRYPFQIQGYKGTLPAGTYRLEVDEEHVGDLPFPAYKRTQVTLHLKADPARPGVSEMLALPPHLIDAALARDRRHGHAVRPRPVATALAEDISTKRALERGEDEGMLWIKDAPGQSEKDARVGRMFLDD
ncbi:hypothetical protein [Kordiimonas marina]|uniref:hypothetical protein n=1 Tax=Kordiimonas marina TaxID=2872312 RepID=UPI001FF2CDEF|nr:hypothetical protein [Kordiimonas marina]MCJ9429653.1 hypothetical protein [Kordiimonas marina]